MKERELIKSTSWTTKGDYDERYWTKERGAISATAPNTSEKKNKQRNKNNIWVWFCLILQVSSPFPLIRTRMHFLFSPWIQNWRSFKTGKGRSSGLTETPADCGAWEEDPDEEEGSRCWSRTLCLSSALSISLSLSRISARWVDWSGCQL